MIINKKISYDDAETDLGKEMSKRDSQRLIGGHLQGVTQRKVAIPVPQSSYFGLVPYRTLFNPSVFISCQKWWSRLGQSRWFDLFQQ